MKKCMRCDNLVGQLFLECCQCEQVIHARCTKLGATPGNLAGDIFYVFTCEDCNDEEQYERTKMAWVDVVGLVLYNLQFKHFEDSDGEGFFHRDRITKFLNANYYTIFPFMRTKRKSWRMMLNVTLSKFPEYFEPREGLTRNDMYYRLASQDFLPNQPLLDRTKQSKKRKISGQKKEEESSGESDSISDYDSSSQDTASVYDEQCLAERQLMSFKSESMYSKSYVKPSDRLSDYLFAGEEENITEADDVDIEALDTAGAVSFNDAKTQEKMSILNSRGAGHSEDAGESNDSEETLSADDMETKMEISELETKKSRLERNPRSNILPWVVPMPSIHTTKSRPMSTSEELYELARLSRRIKSSEFISLGELRIHRKLALRKLKRERGLPLFDIDAWSRGEGSSSMAESSVRSSRVLDRYQKHTLTHVSQSQQQSFWMRLMGQSQELTCFTSPLTNRVLKPIIRVDTESRPLWLRLCNEIRSRGGNVGDSSLSPIIYSYARPHHIPAVNSLAEQYFWPGINLSESLQYPDFSCVALYKKLVVGFAFLVPDVDFHEAYISFIFTRPEWRRAGIATFMLYHLTQTCIGKDITLHVSATNPALLLYQKFGFKVEEFVQDFYDKYLPVNSTECRHALYLRLSR